MKRRKFTLIEMLVVLCIIGILMSLFLVGVQHAINAGKRTKFLGEVASIRAALEQYKNKNGSYPSGATIDYTALNTTPITSPWETTVYTAVDTNSDGVIDSADTGVVFTDLTTPADYPIAQSAAVWTKDRSGKVIKSWE